MSETRVPTDDAKMLADWLRNPRPDQHGLDCLAAANALLSLAAERDAWRLLYEMREP